MTLRKPLPKPPVAGDPCSELRWRIEGRKNVISIVGEDLDKARTEGRAQDAADLEKLLSKEKAELADLEKQLADCEASTAAGAPRVPTTPDELAASLTKPGVTVVSLSHAGMLAPDLIKDGKVVAPGTLFNGITPEVSVAGGSIKVDLPAGSVTVTLSAKGGRLVADGKSGLKPFVDDADVTEKVQERLDAFNRQIQAAGMNVTDVRVDGGQVRITTAPK